jgi:hypothetical protein
MLSDPDAHRRGLEGAEVLRQAAMDQFDEKGFAEYFEPFTGEPLGDDQSWTAAVALDRLA